MAHDVLAALVTLQFSRLCSLSPFFNMMTFRKQLLQTSPIAFVPRSLTLLLLFAALLHFSSSLTLRHPATLSCSIKPLIAVALYHHFQTHRNINYTLQITDDVVFSYSNRTCYALSPKVTSAYTLFVEHNLSVIPPSENFITVHLFEYSPPRTFTTVLVNCLLVPILLSTLWFGMWSVHEIRCLQLNSHSSNAWHLLKVDVFKLQVSTPYRRADNN